MAAEIHSSAVGFERAAYAMLVLAAVLGGYNLVQMIPHLHLNAGAKQGIVGAESGL